MATNPRKVHRAGWPLTEWLYAAGGWSRSKFYEFDETTRPQTVRVGGDRGKIVVVEAPEKWLERMGQQQRARRGD